MKTLTIKLAAPLQSYGNQANFERRTTGDYPTKSAVVGLLAASLGYHREDARIQQLNALAFAVRIDQVGVPLTDFHTVEWKAGTRKITHRDYLQDAVFVAAVGSDDASLIDHLEFAVHHPRFQQYLGRRANVPAGPLRTTTHADQDPVIALTRLPWQAADWYRRRQPSDYVAEIIADASLLDASRTQLAKDVAESSNQRDRRFTFRAIAERPITLQNPHHRSDTIHDIWQTL